MKNKITRFLRKVAATILILIYIAIVVAVDIGIWKLAGKGYHIDPFYWIGGFTMVMFFLFWLYLVFVIAPVLPDRKERKNENNN